MRHSAAEIEERMAPYLPKEEGYAKRCIEAMNYALCAGGKRIRPMLTLLAWELYGGLVKAPVIDCFMTAMEMIHTSSLVHDDLPALDNDDLRRGRPTVHVAFDETTAVLAGDALLNYAFLTAAKAFSAEPENARVEHAMQLLCKLPGIDGMLGGQAFDCEMTGKPLEKEELNFIYEKKTSALIICSLQMGAVLGGAPEEDLPVLEKIGNLVGLAFQVQDDILDVTGTEETLGKPIHSDEKNEKNTYVALYGLSAAKDYVKDSTKEAMQLLENLQVKDEKAKEDLKELLLSLVERDR